jgi:hypothetical protein
MSVAVLEYERCRDLFITKSREYGAARVQEQQLENERHVAKMAAVLRLLPTENPLTGKPYSVTGAESYVETDAEYAAYLASQRAAVMARIDAEAARDAARSDMHVASAMITGAPR